MLDYQRKGFTQYGAQMGRASTSDLVGPLTARKVPIDDGGYDPGGAYWGTPDNLYHVADGAGGDFYARASGLAVVRAMFPGATWESAPPMATEDDLADMVQAYATAALWSSTGDDGEPLDLEHNDSDLTAECRASMGADCERFAAENAPALARCIDDGASWGQIGHDFWLSRNGHGCGFFDRDYGTKPDRGGLQDAARAFGEVYLYVTDGGQVSA